MNHNNETTDKPKSTKLLETSFLLSVTGMSIIGGFGMALAMAKKKDPVYFFLKGTREGNDKNPALRSTGMMPTKELPESGGALAMRALGWGTFYAVSGFSVFCFGVWKMMGLQEFRLKVGNFLPNIPKSENPGRSDFKSVRELMNYLVEESEKGKKS
ncbi:transmembrane protein 242 [Caerostris extrusa]|uniref:Transmembrane protein 242 n=1 Tax=Caerostris extrusa TaxID=172846 RepID=A0AAV4QT99_CAEEX|nr:transmembrane protein 242 [Caerostris extrusa]